MMMSPGQTNYSQFGGGADLTNDYNVGKSAPATLRLMCPPHGSMGM